MASAAVSCSTPSMCNIKKNTARPQAEVQDAQDREATRVRGGGVEFTLGGWSAVFHEAEVAWSCETENEFKG